MSLKRVEKPFLFRTQLSLVLLTGLKAGNVMQLKEQLQTVPESSVHYHTHNFLQRHQFLIPEPPNDFAYWSANVLKEERLGEALAAVDTVRFRSLNDLRQCLVSTMGSFLEKNTVLREAPPGSEFYFMKAILFDFPTSHQAWDLSEFEECLKKISIHSLYYHMFEGRLRTSRGGNDFSVWLDALGETSLARKVDRLDPYTHTLEELRARIVHLVEKRAREESHATVS